MRNYDEIKANNHFVIISEEKNPMIFGYWTDPATRIEWTFAIIDKKYWEHVSLSRPARMADNETLRRFMNDVFHEGEDIIEIHTYGKSNTVDPHCRHIRRYKGTLPKGWFDL